MFQVVFNRSQYDRESLTEAKELALYLVEANSPFIAKVFEVDEDGDRSFVCEFNATHAVRSNCDD